MPNRTCVLFLRMNLTMHVLWLIDVLLIVYLSLYLIVEWKVNAVVPTPYMDEVFHYPMTVHYFRGNCSDESVYSLGNITYWDPKITTFPGLYIVGSL